ncbi:hypothetical protein BLNAU_14612 [Blattamonas nauphoetae]|uniref:Uncharacterized protein n=1 Tax=Blattamonas nauphoetae TaxID=2049346 RepID=A0ABQ9XFN3_9EUKA|nr:hypothetical protein BLNAU_14612 [Blattamonas nauphoetae]
MKECPTDVRNRICRVVLRCGVLTQKQFGENGDTISLPKKKTVRSVERKSADGRRSRSEDVLVLLFEEEEARKHSAQLPHQSSSLWCPAARRDRVAEMASKEWVLCRCERRQERHHTNLNQDIQIVVDQPDLADDCTCCCSDAAVVDRQQLHNLREGSNIVRSNVRRVLLVRNEKSESKGSSGDDAVVVRLEERPEKTEAVALRNDFDAVLLTRTQRECVADIHKQLVVHHCQQADHIKKPSFLPNRLLPFAEPGECLNRTCRVDLQADVARLEHVDDLLHQVCDDEERSFSVRTDLADGVADCCEKRRFSVGEEVANELNALQVKEEMLGSLETSTAPADAPHCKSEESGVLGVFEQTKHFEEGVLVQQFLSVRRILRKIRERSGQTGDCSETLQIHCLHRVILDMRVELLDFSVRLACGLLRRWRQVSICSSCGCCGLRGRRCACLVLRSGSSNCLG